jgi:hypothetical protein
MKPSDNHFIVRFIIYKVLKCIEWKQFSNQLILLLVFSNLLEFYATEGRYGHMYYEIIAKIEADV